MVKFPNGKSTMIHKTVGDARHRTILRAIIRRNGLTFPLDGEEVGGGSGAEIGVEMLTVNDEYVYADYIKNGSPAGPEIRASVRGAVDKLGELNVTVPEVAKLLNRAGDQGTVARTLYQLGYRVALSSTKTRRRWINPDRLRELGLIDGAPAVTEDEIASMEGMLAQEAAEYPELARAAEAASLQEQVLQEEAAASVALDGETFSVDPVPADGAAPEDRAEEAVAADVAEAEPAPTADIDERTISVEYGIRFPDGHEKWHHPTKSSRDFPRTKEERAEYREAYALQLEAIHFPRDFAAELHFVQRRIVRLPVEVIED